METIRSNCLRSTTEYVTKYSVKAKDFIKSNCTVERLTSRVKEMGRGIVCPWTTTDRFKEQYKSLNHKIAVLSRVKSTLESELTSGLVKSKKTYRKYSPQQISQMKERIEEISLLLEDLLEHREYLKKTKHTKELGGIVSFTAKFALLCAPIPGVDVLVNTTVSTCVTALQEKNCHHLPQTELARTARWNTRFSTIAFVITTVSFAIWRNL